MPDAALRPVTDREIAPGIHHIEDGLGVCMTLITGRDRALLVDTGYGLADVAALVRGRTDLPLTVVLTHGHHDHALGARFFPEVWAGPGEAAVLAVYSGPFWRRRVAASARATGQAFDEEELLRTPMPPVRELSAETVLDLGGRTARVIPCPGHTPGSLVVHLPQDGLLLTGDDWNPCTWLFFPEALSARDYLLSVPRLLDLPFDRVLCSHQGLPQPRALFEAFLAGLTPEALRSAPPAPEGREHGIDTAAVQPCEGGRFVFDRRKALG